MAPAAGVANVVLVVVRLILGAAMMYYGWPKLRAPGKNSADFDGMGFKPGWLWGTLVLGAEFFGGIGIVAGFLTPLAAAAFGFEMLLGFLWKAFKAGKPFPEYSYDLQLFALCLMLLVTGPGRFSVDAVLW
jgi:putative oxidoreductase